MKIIAAVVCLGIGIAMPSSAFGQAPALVNYQGRLLSGTNLYNGAASLRFNLYTSETAVVQFYQCTSQVMVVDGLYSTRLGEFETIGTLADALTNAQAFLEVVVNGTPLAPRERMGSVAYALRSQTALGVVPGGVSSAMIAAGAVSGVALGNDVLTNLVARADSNLVWAALNSISSSRIVDGTISGADLADNAIASNHIAAGAISGRELADYIEIGATNAPGELHVFRTTANTPGISIVGGSSQISTFGNDGQEQIRLWGVGYGELLLCDSSPENFVTAKLTANGTSGGVLTLLDNSGSVRLNLAAARSNTAANISVRGTNPAVTTVSVSGGTISGGLIQMRNPSGNTRVTLDAGSATNASELSLINTAGAETVLLSSGGSNVLRGSLVLHDASASVRVGMDAGPSAAPSTFYLINTAGVESVRFLSSGTNVILGPVGIGTNLVEAPFHVVEGASGADPAVPDSIAVFERSADSYITMKAGTNSIQGLVFATAVSNHDAAIIYNFQNERSLRFRTRGSVTRMIITTNGNVGIGTTDPTNRLHVIGTVQANALVTGSDVNAKENIAPVSAEEILARVVALPIATWNFRDDPSGTHLGPMAQDFRAAFGLGNTDTGIFTVDADGVALAAIQALARQNAELRLSNAELKRQNEDVLKRLDGVLLRLQALETK